MTTYALSTACTKCHRQIRESKKILGDLDISADFPLLSTSQNSPWNLVGICGVTVPAIQAILESRLNDARISALYALHRPGINQMRCILGKRHKKKSTSVMETSRKYASTAEIACLAHNEMLFR